MFCCTSSSYPKKFGKEAVLKGSESSKESVEVLYLEITKLEFCHRLFFTNLPFDLPAIIKIALRLFFGSTKYGFC